MGKVFKSNTWLLILDLEVAIWDLLSSTFLPCCPAEYMYSEKYAWALNWHCAVILLSLRAQLSGQVSRVKVLDLKTLPIFSPLKISLKRIQLELIPNQDLLQARSSIKYDESCISSPFDSLYTRFNTILDTGTSSKQILIRY